MVQFYTGGMDTSLPTLSDDSIAVICKILKAHHYEKNLKLTLDNYDHSKVSSYSGRTIKSTVYSCRTVNDLERKPKSTLKNNEESQEAAIKRKIVENK